MNSIKYNLITNKLIDVDDLGIYSAKNKLLIPFNIQDMSYREWFNNFKKIKLVHSVIKFLIRYNRFYECGYRSDTLLLKEVKKEIVYYLENYNKEFMYIYNRYNYTLNAQSKECSKITIF